MCKLFGAFAGTLSRKFRLVLLVTFQISAVSAQPFVRPNVVPSPPPCNTNFPAKLAIRCWVGQKLLITSAGISFFRFPETPGPDGVAGPELFGKIVVVTEVRQKDEPTQPWRIFFKDDVGQTYYADAVGDANDPYYAFVLGVVLLRDLEAARNMFLNKRYYIKVSRLPSIQSREHSVRFNKFQPVLVTDVLANPDFSYPICLVVKSDEGEEACANTAVSASNGANFSGSADGANYFGKSIEEQALPSCLSSDDLKQVFKWPESMWDAIENDAVVVGMSQIQATFSWGFASHENRTVVGSHVYEQWVYDDDGDARYLYFEDGKLTDYQD